MQSRSSTVQRLPTQRWSGRVTAKVAVTAIARIEVPARIAAPDHNATPDAADRLAACYFRSWHARK